MAMGDKCNEKRESVKSESRDHPASFLKKAAREAGRNPFKGGSRKAPRR